MTEGLAGAIDLGGTKILAAVVDHRGRIVAEERRPTDPRRGPDTVIADMAGALTAACDRAGVTPSDLVAAGVAAAGPVDAASGTLTEPPNLPGWHKVPLAELLNHLTGIPIVLENDANAAAIGEHAFGAGRDVRHMVYLTVSTGIGGGIIVDGEIYRGVSGAAGEIGHMTIQVAGPLCGCGRHGCLEALASGTAIAREAERLISEGRAPKDGALARTARPLTAEAVATAARAGDTAAAEVLAQAADYLGVGLMNIVHIFNPELIVIGGGASKIGEPLVGRAEALMRSHAFPLMANAVRVVSAALGDDSGVLGAAALAFKRQRAAT